MAKPDNTKVIETTAKVTDAAPAQPSEPASATKEQPSEPERSLATLGQHALDAFKPAEEGGGGLALPRVVVTQSLSRVVTREDDPKPLGILLNTLTMEEYGKSIDVMILARWPQRIYLTVTEGLKCRSNSLIGPAAFVGGIDAQGQPTDDCTRCLRKLFPKTRVEKYGDKLDPVAMEKGPECSEVENFLALFINGTNPDDYEPILLSFSKTSLKAGRQIASMVALSRKPYETFKYRVKVVRATGPNQAVYYKQEIERIAGEAGRSTEAEIKSAQRWMRDIGAQQTTILETAARDDSTRDDLAAAAAAGATEF